MSEPNTPNQKRTSSRRAVHRTHKAYVNGSFTRSESGRTYKVSSRSGLIDAVDCSRKDTRDAIRAAASAAEKWSSMSPYLRGQILYRLAEMLESASYLTEFAAELGLRSSDHRQAADLAVHYAGFTDKLGQILGSTNAVAGHFSATEPLGLGATAVYLPADAGLLAQVEAGLAALAAGNSVLVTAPGESGVLACALAERLAVSDLPAGVWNILPSTRLEVVSTLAGATDVKAIDLLAHPQRTDLESRAALSLTKVRPTHTRLERPHGSLANLRWQLDYRTIVAPIGK